MERKKDVGVYPDFRRGLVPSDMLTLIESHALNRARWDALVFFGSHPSAETRADTLAQLSGQTARAVEHELDDLMGLGILRACQVDNQKLYALAIEPSVRNAVICFARRSAFD